MDAYHANCSIVARTSGEGFGHPAGGNKDPRCMTPEGQKKIETMHFASVCLSRHSSMDILTRRCRLTSHLRRVLNYVIIPPTIFI
jgi:hypothetical protein